MGEDETVGGWDTSSRTAQARISLQRVPWKANNGRRKWKDGTPSTEPLLTVAQPPHALGNENQFIPNVSVTLGNSEDSHDCGNALSHTAMQSGAPPPFLKIIVDTSAHSQVTGQSRILPAINTGSHC